MLPLARSISIGRPVVPGTALLPLSFLPSSEKETIFDFLCLDGCALHGNAHEGVFRVRCISSRGIFVETTVPWSAGAVSKLDFLVPEGQIRADAVVRYVGPDGGVGLKFTAVREEDRPKLAASITRLRSLSQSPRTAR